MVITQFWILQISGLIALWLVMLLPKCLPVLAQTVRSDLTTGSVVNGSSSFTITEGAVRLGDTGATLFHSFDTFSPAASAVTFDLRDSQNAVDTAAVTSILGRVTGGAPSFIDGQLSVLRDSNTPVPSLFLINPKGVLFGENAQLSLPGSFLASTAESLLFEGAEFSAANPGAAPLLTVSTPVGLQFGSENSAGITVRGTGHAIATSNPLFAPYFPIGISSGLSVAPGESLRLIGRSIDTSGGVLSAPGGRIELGSVREGIVFLRNQGIDYSAISQFGDIRLAERSLINVSGPLAGEVQLQGRQISLSDGSLIWSQNRGLSAAGEVSVRATERLFLTGTTPTLDAVSGIVTETLGPGNAGTVDINTAQLSVEAGTMLGSRSFSAGNSGHVRIVAEQANISGYVPVVPNIFSVVGTLSSSTGAAGDVSLLLQNLSVTEGGYLGSATLGSGRGGDITITANTVDVIGATPTSIASSIVTSAAGVSGDAGNIVLKTRRLRLQDSGIVSTSSINVANAGDIWVEASEQIDISGGLPNLPESTIASTVDFPPVSIGQVLGLSGTPRGAAGNVTVSTPVLEISDSCKPCCRQCRTAHH